MQDTVKWLITQEEKAQHDLLVKLANRLTARAQAEKQAKAEGRWDYRNNKIVEA